MTLRTLTLTAVLAFGSLLAGCASNADSICDKRHSCYDNNLDTGKCADGIDAWVKAGDEGQRREHVAECARCVEERSCTQVLESCIDDCFDIP